MKQFLENINTWFFELIEDAVGKKTMDKYRAEERNRVKDLKE